MRVTVLSQDQIEHYIEEFKYKFLTDNFQYTAFIGIGDKHKPSPLKSFDSDKIIALEFDDVEKTESYPILLFQQFETLNPISDSQAKELKEFIEKNKHLNIVVHCLMGISRSQAVARYISETYGHVIENRLPTYNKIVYKKLKNR